MVPESFQSFVFSGDSNFQDCHGYLCLTVYGTPLTSKAPKFARSSIFEFNFVYLLSISDGRGFVYCA